MSESFSPPPGPFHCPAHSPKHGGVDGAEVCGPEGSFIELACGHLVHNDGTLFTDHEQHSLFYLIEGRCAVCVASAAELGVDLTFRVGDGREAGDE